MASKKLTGESGRNDERLNGIGNKERSERISEKRRAYKDQLADNELKSRRIWFAREVIKQKGFTVKEVAERIGVTQQHLSWCFVIQDDCYLSLLKKILAAVGVDCAVSFELGPETAEQQEPREDYARLYRFKGDFVLKGPQDEPVCSPDSNLYFLYRLIKAEKDTLNAFAGRVDMELTTLQRCLRNDDIKISFLCKIAEKTGRKIIWELNDMASSGQAD